LPTNDAPVQDGYFLSDLNLNFNKKGAFLGGGFAPNTWTIGTIVSILMKAPSFSFWTPSTGVQRSDNVLVAKEYDDLQKVFHYIRQAGSSNTIDMTKLFDFPGTNRVKVRFNNGVYFDYFEDNLGIPQGLKFFSPQTGKEFGFSTQNLNQENFPAYSGDYGSYGIRIIGDVYGRYSRLGTVYFNNWNTFYNFCKYIFLGN